MVKDIKILMVDDMPENLLVLQGVLESPEYELVCALSGEEALKKLLHEQFAVILLDVQMPGLNGYDTARLIRIREKTRHTPIIFITADLQIQERVHEGYELGAIDYIFKPFDPESLRYKIAGFVNLYRHQEQLEILIQERTRALYKINAKLCQEVEQRKETERKLQKEIRERKYSETLLEGAFENHLMGIVLETEEGKIIKANAVFQKLIGYTEEELQRMACSEFTHPEDHTEDEGLFKQLVNGNINHYKIEKRFIRKDGEVIWVNLSVASSWALDQKLVIAFTNDITHKKILEGEIARLDRLNTVGELAAGISHEVRNPLTTVKGFLQVLHGKKDCEQYSDYFEIMIEEIDRANSIITEFLSISQRVQSQMEKGSLNRILETLFPLIEADALGQDKTVKLITGDIPELLLNNKEIRQLILNLCRNGLEAMSSGGVLTLLTYIEEDKVILSVQDQGHGIPDEVLDKLGTPFLTTKANGTGLGIGICYKIAQKHQAAIEIDTSPKGTTFYIKFKNNC